MYLYTVKFIQQFMYIENRIEASNIKLILTEIKKRRKPRTNKRVQKYTQMYY